MVEHRDGGFVHALSMGHHSPARSSGVRYLCYEHLVFSYLASAASRAWEIKIWQTPFNRPITKR